MPHHPVIRQDKVTNKIRSVCNASFKLGVSPSLNECFDPGPNLVPDIVDVLLRFQMKPVAFIANIEQPFLQIKLVEGDAKALRRRESRSLPMERATVRARL